MRKVKVITDSCSDLTPELLERYDIDYAKMSTLSNGTETPACLEWTSTQVHEFYERMRNGERITTAQVSVTNFNEIFRKYLDLGYDIIYIACCSKQSGSVNTGNMTARKVLEDYPDASIICIDSLNASIGEGILAIEAAKMAKDSKSIEEIAEYITSIRNNVLEYVTVHTLDYLKRAGRVSAPSAFFGNLMGVKPILISDANGVQTPLKKVKGRKNSITEIVALLKENIIAPEEQTLYIAHSDCNAEELETLYQLLKCEINCREICVVGIGPIIGASIGPDCISVWGMGKEITYRIDD